MTLADKLLKKYEKVGVFPGGELLFYIHATTLKADKVIYYLMDRGYKLVNTDSPNKVTPMASDLRITGNGSSSKYVKNKDTVLVWYGGGDSYEISGNDKSTIDKLDKM